MVNAPFETLSLRPLPSFLRFLCTCITIVLLVYILLQVAPCLRLLLSHTIKLNGNPLRLMMYREDIHLPTLRTPLLHFGP